MRKQTKQIFYPSNLSNTSTHHCSCRFILLVVASGLAFGEQKLCVTGLRETIGNAAILVGQMKNLIMRHHVHTIIHFACARHLSLINSFSTSVMVRCIGCHYLQ